MIKKHYKLMEDEISKLVCEKCNAKGMLIISKKRVQVDAEEANLDTDGQQADYMAAEESGEPGEFGIEETIYRCPKCGYEKISQEM